MWDNRAVQITENSAHYPKTLINSLGGGIFPESFYRSLNNLQKRGMINWIKEHGGPNSPSGLVSIARKKVLCVDCDSKIPNLALLKISAFHKQQGHDVTLQRGLKIANNKEKYDFVYMSCIFTKNRSEARKLCNKLSKQFPDAEMHIGGAGISLSTTLPDDIESLMPDYDLYPEMNYSLGYSSRGCSRNCGFCFVPKMKWEGKPHAVGDIYKFYNPRFRKMVLLDNNIFSVPHDHFKRIGRQIIKEKIDVNFTTGLDIKFLDDEKAKLLKKMHISQPRFAWDDIRDEHMVMRGIEVLRQNGIKRSLFYVLVGFNSTLEEDLYRLEKLKAVGQRAYVMRYETVRGEPEYNYLAAWANQPRMFETMTFEVFKAKSKLREEGRKDVTAERSYSS
ncbi:MAG: hypothetical protein ABR985_03810 [Methanotrichaceae archaeon]